jgi:DNA-binding PadR family transcriptional regulator
LGAEKDFLGASTSLLVLACLRKEPSYGYEILKVLNRDGEGLFQWQEGTLYPILHRLQKEGLVRAQWQDADAAAGGRKRKYYYITAKGRGALTQQAARWNVLNSMVKKLTGASHVERKPVVGRDI